MGLLSSILAMLLSLIGAGSCSSLALLLSLLGAGSCWAGGDGVEFENEFGSVTLGVVSANRQLPPCQVPVTPCSWPTVIPPEWREVTEDIKIISVTSEASNGPPYAIKPEQPSKPKPKPKKKSKPRDPYKREGKYWLVPPFLIGAASVLVLYVFIHCVYLHCYTNRKGDTNIKKRTAPTILFNEAHSNASPMQVLTPMVKYDGPYGKTEVVEAQPFLVCQPFDEGDDASEPCLEKRPSIQVQLPRWLGGGGGGRGDEPRRSVCSTGAIMEDTGGGLEAPDGDRLHQTRASICFVPVGHSVGDASDTSTEWTPLQGFVYSSFVFARKPSYNMAVGAGGLDSAYSLNDESTTSPPFLQVPGSSDNHLLGSQLSNPDLTSGTSMLDIAGDIKITVSADPTADTSEDPVDNIRIRFSPPVSRHKQTSSPTCDIKLHKQTSSPTGDIKLLISPDSPDCAINGSINNHSPSTPSVTITIDDDSGNKADELQ